MHIPLVQILVTPHTNLASTVTLIVSGLFHFHFILQTLDSLFDSPCL